MHCLEQRPTPTARHARPSGALSSIKTILFEKRISLRYILLVKVNIKPYPNTRSRALTIQYKHTGVGKVESNEELLTF